MFRPETRFGTKVQSRSLLDFRALEVINGPLDGTRRDWKRSLAQDIIKQCDPEPSGCSLSLSGAKIDNGELEMKQMPEGLHC